MKREELIGSQVTIMESAQEGMKGLSGRVVDETATFFVIDFANGRKRVRKTGAKFLFEGKTQPGDTPGVLLAASELTPGVISNGYIPATTRGIFTLLDYYKILVEGKHIVVVGRSTLVGKPTALLALNKNATVTICHSKTQDLPAITKTADILIVAAGQPKLITKDHVGKNQVVIDVGINVIKSHSNLRGYDTPTSQVDKIQPESEPTDRKLVGDVDFDSVSKVVAAISPVPGGIGPMTVASLFQNLLQAYIHQNA